MSENCENTKHPLLRDGTSQLRRLLKALLPSYVAVDERSMEDLIAFVQKYAAQIHFFGPNNQINGDWVDFFKQKADETNAATEPHYALFLAFLELFRVAQDDLNSITQRHLDFYYREVLQLKEKPAVPDQVFLVFGLAKNTMTALLEKDTLMNAGKDGIGKELSYAIDRNIVINRATVANLKAIYADRANDYRIYASPVANSGDGIGGPVAGDEPKWKTFGRTISFPNADRPAGVVGFAIASPVLLLKEGEREIRLTLNFNQPVPTNVPLANAFRVLFSGEKKWLEADPGNSYNRVTISGSSLIIQRKLVTGEKAIVPHTAALSNLPEDKWPIVKVLLDETVAPLAYAALKGLELLNVRIDVNVTGVKSIVAFNDNAKLKTDKPFEPFGNRPLLGNSFYLGNEEIFSKKLNSISLLLEWQGLPGVSFNGYYYNYVGSDSSLRTNDGFQVNISVLDKKNWVYLGTQSLFIDNVVFVSSHATNNNMQTQQRATPPAPFRYYTFAGNPLSTINRDPELGPVTKIDNDTFKGFMRLELTGVDFGHKDFASSLTQRVTEAIVNNVVPPVVNTPYTPTIKSLLLNYSSSATITFAESNETQFAARVEKFFYVQPFGYREVHPLLFVRPEKKHLLPQFDDEGNLYIGLNGLQPAQIVSILFKVAEGSANPDREKQTVNWSYLSNDQWVDFPPLKMLSDGTGGLLTSGIVTLDVPSDATNTNTSLPSGLHWLRVSVTDFSDAVCDLIDVRAQAVTATFVDNDNDPEHLRLPLPAGTIAKFRENHPQVKKTEQPYASFGGKMKETSQDFYMRVSERLRHKHRAVTIWDYEHLVLEHFPSVYKVKCISHTQDTPAVYSELAPGHVTLIAVSNLRNKNMVNPLQPKTSLTDLENIKDYITPLTSWWVELDVRNPVFEELRVDFSVRFRAGFDNGFYGQKLNEDIRKFLSPWAYDPGQDIAFGGKIHRSTILNYIEELEYVDFVSCFRMDHLAGAQVIADVVEATPLTAASILVSAAQHTITVLKTDDCGCDDNEQTSKIKPADDVSCAVTSAPEPSSGIGSEEVGEEIIGFDPPDAVGEGVNYFQIENDFIIE